MSHAIQCKGLDHLVLTAGDTAASVAFYVNLGMTHQCAENGRHELLFGSCKINLHGRPGEFQPAARTPLPGSADVCFEVQGPMSAVQQRLAEVHLTIELGPVRRTGARGLMKSVYLRDPDGNLVELAVYG